MIVWFGVIGENTNERNRPLSRRETQFFSSSVSAELPLSEGKNLKDDQELFKKGELISLPGQLSVRPLLLPLLSTSQSSNNFATDKNCEFSKFNQQLCASTSPQSQSIKNREYTDVKRNINLENIPSASVDVNSYGVYDDVTHNSESDVSRKSYKYELPLLQISVDHDLLIPEIMSALYGKISLIRNQANLPTKTSPKSRTIRWLVYPIIPTVVGSTATSSIYGAYASSESVPNYIWWLGGGVEFGNQGGEIEGSQIIEVEEESQVQGSDEISVEEV